MDIQFEENEDSALDYEDGESIDVPSTQENELVKDSDTVLVETVYNFPALYDKELKEYHDAGIRKNCWENVAVITEKEVSYCQKRWTQLRDSYTGERRRRLKDARSGSGQTKRKGFALYENMSFLERHIKQKPTFTNAAPVGKRPFIKNVERYCLPLLTPSSSMPTSTIALYADTAVTDVLRTDLETAANSFSFLPPTPPSHSSTPPPAPIMESLSVLRPTPLLPLTISTEPCGVSMPASSTPPPPSRTPTPSTSSSVQLSPRSPFSPCSDTSYTYGSDDPAQLSSSTTNPSFSEGFSRTESKSVPPKKCYTKDSRLVKKVDPVEKCFLTLTTTLQDHFSQKPVAKEAEMKKPVATDTEELFGLFIAAELQKMDDETKKNF